MRSLVLLFFMAWPSLGMAQDKLKIVTTFSVLADMVQHVAGPSAEVVSITKRGAEIHGYRPTPQDIVQTLDADLVFSNGLNLEGWFNQFLRHIGDVPTVTLTNGLEPLFVSGSRSEDAANPHAWMSFEHASLYIDNIVEGLVQIDPFRSETYRQNGDAYLETLAAALEPLKAKLDSVPTSQRWLVSCEGAFGYLAQDLGLQELYIWPMNAEQNGTPDQMRNVIDVVRQQDIPVVFCESTISPDPALQIARETGARYGGVLYVDTLTSADGPAPTYYDLMVGTVTLIVEELTRE